MSSNLNNILNALPNLTQTELTSVKAVVEQLQSVQSAADATTPLYDALCAILSIKMTYKNFCNHNFAHKAWKKHAPGTINFMEETWPETKRSKIFKWAVMNMLLETLRDNLRDRKIPITLGTICNNLGSVPEAFDLAFPSYRESGLSNLIMKQMTSKKKEKET